MQGFNCLFGSLLGCKASPLMTIMITRVPSLPQIPLCLFKPVFGTVGHVYIIPEKIEAKKFRLFGNRRKDVRIYRGKS